MGWESGNHFPRRMIPRFRAISPLLFPSLVFFFSVYDLYTSINLLGNVLSPRRGRISYLYTVTSAKVTAASHRNFAQALRSHFRF